MHSNLFCVLLVGAIGWLCLSNVGVVESRTPWDPPPNCTAWKCNDTDGTTEQACFAKGTVGQYKFYPTGTTCNCPLCMKVQAEGENCDELLIMDKASPYECAAGTKCDSTTRTCSKVA